ncbi:hypothetical protein C0081_12055 [Cohaesibacter celericrescens]|uniref:Uncharacterized protein n=2 Tax=Cohaesibacter celericrescens TaxID=2067669 RepID=A0A2N5XQJ8_9HYPH|nr:hypothetical protein C0081_12055 [Cohaesibacter celericrescens]
MAFSGLLAGCQTDQAIINSLCEARVVRVSPAVKAEFRKWLTANGHLKTDAPTGAEDFLKDLKVNQDVIRQQCGR